MELLWKFLYRTNPTYLLCRDMVRLFVGHLVVYNDTTAVFANDDFFTLADIELALWRHFAKTTAASVSFDRHYRQAVAGIFTNTFECCLQAVIYSVLKVFGRHTKVFFFLFGLYYYLVELCLLEPKVFVLLLDECR